MKGRELLNHNLKIYFIMTTRKIDIDTPETMFTGCNWSNCASQIKKKEKEMHLPSVGHV